MKRNVLLVLPALLLLPSAALAGWELDNTRTGIHFQIRNFGIMNVRGTFERFTGNVVYDEEDVTRSKAEVTIDAASIRTGIGRRDKDLRGASYLDVAKYPAITFTSRRVERAAPGRLRMIGDLTMHGVTREVALDIAGPTPPADDPDGNAIVGGTATTTIHRKDYGIDGSSLVGNEVGITIDVRLVNTGK